MNQDKIPITDDDILRDLRYVPGASVSLLKIKQARRNQCQEFDSELRSEGHIVIDDPFMCDYFYSCGGSEEYIIENYGYSSEPELKVFLCSSYSSNHLSVEEPYCVMDWPMK